MGIKINVIPDFVNMGQTLLATAILFLVLRHFLFKPVQELLAKRKAYIEDGVKTKEEADKQLEKMNEDYQAKILEARKESSEIISSARAYGEDIKSKAVEESRKLAQDEYDKGMIKLENEKKKAMKSMNDEIVDIALSATEKLLKEKTSTNTDKEMVKSLISDLEKTYEWESC